MMVVARVAAADGKHDRSHEASGGADDQKDGHLHAAEADDVGEGILGEAGDQKEDEGDRNAAVLHEVIILLNDFWTDDPFDKRHSEPSGQQKREPRADREADRRVDRSQNGSVEIPADKAVQLARNRRYQNLDDLKADEDHHREGAE